jgi:hypothetical protein
LRYYLRPERPINSGLSNIGKKMKLPVPAGDPSTPIEPWIIEEDEEASEVKTVRAAMTCKYRNQGELAHALGIDQSTVSRHIANFVKKKLKIRDHTGSWVTFKKDGSSRHHSCRGEREPL